MSVGWFYLAGAIAAEITATLTLRELSHGWRMLPGAVVVAGYVASFVLLALALRTLSVSIAYAVWAGVGTAGVTILAALLLDTKITWAQVGAIALIITGVALLYLGDVSPS